MRRQLFHHALGHRSPPPLRARRVAPLSAFALGLAGWSSRAPGADQNDRLRKWRIETDTSKWDVELIDKAPREYRACVHAGCPPAIGRGVAGCLETRAFPTF